ncbi:MAG: hypothetical protein PCFJNLEI_03101 [Verrucomicrobiae bacterium]|nr:hypothetical protein [Verrucomicrobiae bacterium]
MKTKSKMTAKRKKTTGGTLAPAIEALTKRMCLEAVKKHGNLEKAAQELGVTAAGLYKMLRRRGIRLRVKVTRTIEISDPQK